MARFLARWTVPALGAAAVVAGVILLTQSSTKFGWYAYAPLSAIAGWVGYRLGHRAAVG